MKKNERTKEEFLAAAKKSYSYAGMCRELGLGEFGANYRRIKRAIADYDIDISHFTGERWNKNIEFCPSTQTNKTIEEILVENSDFDNSHRLKNRLFYNGLKKQQCERCGRTEWEGEPIPLELHHINGVHNDNRIENLQILCPNCHALSDNYCGKNIKSKNSELKRKQRFDKLVELYGEEKAIELLKDKPKKDAKKRVFCEHCGKEIIGKYKSRQKFCSYECAHEHQRKLPNDSEMMKLVNSGKNNSELAKELGVSEASIRKWKKENNK